MEPESRFPQTVSDWAVLKVTIQLTTETRRSRRNEMPGRRGRPHRHPGHCLPLMHSLCVLCTSVVNRYRERNHEKKRKPACKPGSVENSHSSRRRVTATLERPTREQRGPRRCSPIWSCSGWGLPCHRCYQRRGALLPHLFTLACAPARTPGHRRYVFCGTFRRLTPPRRYLAPCPLEPGLSSTHPDKQGVQRLSGRLPPLVDAIPPQKCNLNLRIQMQAHHGLPAFHALNPPPHPTPGPAGTAVSSSGR